MRHLLLLVTCVGMSLAKDCRPFARPWLVIFDERKSGALLNEYWVLTSYSNDAMRSDIVARLGVDDLSETTDYEQKIPVARWVNRNPFSPYYPYSFRRRKRSAHFDLALVRLAWPAHFTPQVQPIPLPTQPAQARERCVVSGWGSTAPYKCEDMPKTSRKQQCLLQPIVDRMSCHDRRNPNDFCAGYEDTTEGNCLWDEGSILACGGVLYGVNSRGGDGCNGRPETYSSVYAYKDWIHKVMYPEICTTQTTPTTITTVDPTWGPGDSTV